MPGYARMHAKNVKSKFTTSYWEAITERKYSLMKKTNRES